MDSDKLQKQTDILDAHHNVTCVHSGFYTIDKDGKNIIRPFHEKCMKRSHSGNVLRTIVKGNYVMLLTTLFRREIFSSDLYLKSPICFFDYTMTYAAAMLGDFYYLPEKMACYRRSPGSAMERMHSNENDPLWKASKLTYSYFSKHMISKKDIRMEDRLILRLHILTFLKRINDKETLKYIIDNDMLSRFLYPLSYIYSTIKK